MNQTEFQQKINQSEKPVIVDFWAPWCGPCRVTKPILENLAQEFSSTIEFLPVNADESGEVVRQFRILGIPTVMAFQGGKVTARITGAQSEEIYRRMFQAIAEGKEVKTSMMPFDRILRLGVGGLFIVAGIFTSSWLVIGIGGAVAFLGIHDRCPIWQAIKGFVLNE
jgi:thioredoxin 1